MLTKIKHKLTNIDKNIFIKNFLFILAVTIIYSLSVNIPLIKLNYPKEYFILALFMSVARDFIIWFIAFLNKWVFAVFSFLSFTAGFGLKYVNEYLNMGLNIGTFEVIFSTNLVEAKGVMNNTLISYFITGAVISIIFTVLRFRLVNNKHKMDVMVGGILLIVSLILLFLGKLPEDFMKTVKYGYSKNDIINVGRGFDIMPEKIYENFYHLFRNKLKMKYMVYKRDSLETGNIEHTKQNNGQIIIFVLTDALRPDHMSLYGYNRETTPYMKQYGFIPFNDMYACETSTTRSVPCLLTSMKRGEDFLSYLTKLSIFSVFKKADFFTAFISSQSSISTSDTGQKVIADDADYSFFNVNFEVKYDTDLIPYFDKLLQNNNENKLIVLQLNGSHWDYNTRFKLEDAKWKPLCEKFALECDVENLINSYDNSILTTDTLLKEIVERVKDKNAVIYFSSDHGQFLGEDGFRLHAQGRLNFKEVGVVPFAFWASEKAKQNLNIDTILNNKDKITTHDAIFHSIADCAGLKASIVDKKLSICSESLTEAPNEFENYISKKAE